MESKLTLLVRTLLLPPAAFFARFVPASYSLASRFAAEAFTR